MDEIATTTGKAAKDLLSIANHAQNGVGMMRDADRQMKRARDQWVRGALLAAEWLHAARMLHKDDISFGNWCDGNELGENRLSRNDRAALIKIGADLDYYREALTKTERWSLRLIVKEDPPPGVSQPVIPTPRHKTPPGPKPKDAAAYARPIRKPTVAGCDLEVEDLVLAYEARTGQFPTVQRSLRR